MPPKTVGAPEIVWQSEIGKSAAWEEFKTDAHII